MYILAITTFSILAYLEVFNRHIVDKYKFLLLFFCYIFLIIHDGLRWETGTDWMPYTDFFNNLTLKYSIEDSPFEIGYTLFMYIIRLITDDYTLYLVIHAIFFYSCFFYCITSISISPLVSILIFYTITLPYLGMNRQFLAMAICSVALVFLLKNNFKIFFLLVFVAFLFHRTALVALLAIICKKKINLFWLIGIISFAILIALLDVPNRLIHITTALSGLDEGTIQKLDIYTHGGDNQTVSFLSTILSLIKKLIWCGLLLVFDNKVDNKDNNYYTLFNLYILGCVLYIIFNGTIFQIFVSRALLYFNIIEMFIIPYALTIFKQNYGKLILMIILSLYCFINIKKGFNNYATRGMKDLFEPYKGIFINTDYQRQSH